MQINSINSAAYFTGRVDSSLKRYIKKQTDGAIQEEILKGEQTGKVDAEKIQIYRECQANIMRAFTEKADKLGSNGYIGLKKPSAKDPNLTLVVGLEAEGEKIVETTPKSKIKVDDPYNPYGKKTEIRNNPYDWILEVRGIENMSGSVYKPEYQLQSLTRMARELAPAESGEKMAQELAHKIFNKAGNE